MRDMAHYTRWMFPGFSYSLVGGLAYGSQLLFRHIEPFGLTISQTLHFNVIVGFVIIGYTRAWLTDPGHVSSEWQPSNKVQRHRWCKKCETFKPARSHHCKVCGRCIPKMDHHCPWTVNCVSHRTLPHFLRFLIYGMWSLILLDSYLFERTSILWSNRHLPSYLGPSAWAMSGLFILILISCITTVCIGILLIRCLCSLVVNVTSIEGWEIERHRTLLRRAKTFGGYLDGPNGTHIPIRRQEFPYDIGIWKNLTQVFGLNILTWLWPFTTTPENDTGLEFEVNGFEDDNTIWPPPDPDRMPRTRINLVEGYTSIEKGITDLERPEVFLVRQPADAWSGGIQRRKQFHKRYMNQENHEKHYTPSDSQEMGEESWRNAEGERLADFGLDEETEFYDEGNPTTCRLSEHRAGLPMEAHRS